MSTTFSVTRDDVISGALRVLGVLGAGETPSAEDYTNCSQALNIMIKAWMTAGMDLWKVQDITLPLVSGVGSYQIGPTATGTGALVTDRPLRIVNAYIRDTSAGNDWTIQMVSRTDYDKLGVKTSPGIVNQAFYDPQLDNGVLYVYNVPNDDTHELHLVCHQPISDITSSTQVPDFPQEWYQALKWGLADEVALEYGANPTTMQIVASKASTFKERMVDWSQEEVSTFFAPSPRFGRQ